MIWEPYKILGIEESATDDEVKKAYRKLSRIYHPDANLNNPNQAEAEEKFKNVQQAYDYIMKVRTGDVSSTESPFGNQSFGGFWGYGRNSYGGSNSGSGYGQSQYQNGEPLEYTAATNYINAGHFREAMVALNNISVEDRSAHWYFLSALGSAGLGNQANALGFATQAVNMEPDNYQYQDLLTKLESGGQWYQTMGSGYGMPQRNNSSDCCSQLCCMELLCGCC